jgi:hypothetical protein
LNFIKKVFNNIKEGFENNLELYSTIFLTYILLSTNSKEINIDFLTKMISDEKQELFLFKIPNENFPELII